MANNTKLLPPLDAVRLTLPYPPSANRYWRNAKGRMIVSAEAQSYKQDVGWLARSQRVRPIPAGVPVAVSVEVYRPRRQGDLDNRLKIVLDALNGIAWADDEQIVQLTAHRFDDAKNPRIVVSIALAPMLNTV